MNGFSAKELEKLAGWGYDISPITADMKDIEAAKANLAASYKAMNEHEGPIEYYDEGYVPKPVEYDTDPIKKGDKGTKIGIGSGLAGLALALARSNKTIGSKRVPLAVAGSGLAGGLAGHAVDSQIFKHRVKKSNEKNEEARANDLENKSHLHRNKDYEDAINSSMQSEDALWKLLESGSGHWKTMPNYKIMGELSGDLDAYNHGSFAEKAFHYTNGDDYYDRAIAGEDGIAGRSAIEDALSRVDREIQKGNFRPGEEAEWLRTRDVLQKYLDDGHENFYIREAQEENDNMEKTAFSVEEIEKIALLLPPPQRVGRFKNIAGEAGRLAGKGREVLEEAGRKIGDNIDTLRGGKVDRARESLDAANSLQGAAARGSADMLSKEEAVELYGEALADAQMQRGQLKHDLLAKGLAGGAYGVGGAGVGLMIPNEDSRTGKAMYSASNGGMPERNIQRLEDKATEKAESKGVDLFDQLIQVEQDNDHVRRAGLGRALLALGQGGIGFAGLNAVPRVPAPYMAPALGLTVGSMMALQGLKNRQFKDVTQEEADKYFADKVDVISPYLPSNSRKYLEKRVKTASDFSLEEIEKIASAKKQ